VQSNGLDESIKRLRSAIPADGWLPAAWQQLQAHLDWFLKTWGDEADFLGWTDRELYGTATEARHARFGEMGLVPILAGRRVIAMDETRATIECRATPGYAPAR
jgi:hypothetical protein